MNRTDRLLAIVLQLQAKGRRRAEDLALVFETSVRTIYRDMQALCEAGVPIVALPGQGYALADEYFLPPLQFSVQEAGTLLLGADFVSKHFDRECRASVQKAAEKIGAVLPQHMRERVEELRLRLRFAAYTSDNPAREEKLRTLRESVLEQRRVRFLYHARRSAEPLPAGQKRECAPYALVNMSGRWYVTGYCYARQALRSFRLDRMEEVEPLAITFVRPAGFKLEDAYDEFRGIRATALFDHDMARWVQEASANFAVSCEKREDGVLMVFEARSVDEIVGWFLEWGRHVRVLEPESLRERIAHEARALLEHHATPVYSS